MFAVAALALLVTLVLAVVRAALGPTVFDRAQAANTIGTVAMLLLAVADDLWLVFIAWEMTSVCSYLLVLHTRAPEARRAASSLR